MAKDFRATQIETTKIILSGGVGPKGMGGMIYSGSVATDREGGFPAAMISNVGSDVFLFVSGTRSNNDFNRTDVTLFGGDVVVSGTLYAERQIIEVDGIVDGDLIVTGNLFVEPDSNSAESVAFRNAAGTNILTVNSTNKRVGIGENTPAAQLEVMSDSTATTIAKLSQFAADADAPDLVFYKARGTHTSPSATVSGDFLGSINFKGFNSSAEKTHAQIFGQSFGTISNTSNPGKLFIRTVNDGETALGTRVIIGPDGNTGTDSNFFVSGSKSSKGTAEPGTAIFGGDLLVSGTLYAESQAFVKTSVGQALNVSTNQVIVNEGGSAFLDFRVETDTKTNAVFVDASNDSVSILGGSGVYPGTDVGFFVSGAVGERGIAGAKSVSSFGGDLVVSGGQNILGGVKVEGGAVFNDFGAGVDFRIESDNNANMFIVKGSTDRVGIGTVSAPQATLHLKETTPTFRIQRSNNSNNSNIEFVGQAGAVGATMFLSSSSNDLTFSTHDGVDQEEILRLGGHQTADVRQVILLSGSKMAASAMQPKKSADINFFVSGSINSAGSLNRGTAVFGGDVVTSGSTHTRGAVHRKTLTASSNFNVGVSDHYMFINTAGGHVTASLQPAANAGAGRELVFKDVGGYADVNFIVIKPAAGEKIESIPDEVKIKVASGSISLISDGTINYFIVGESGG